MPYQIAIETKGNLEYIGETDRLIYPYGDEWVKRCSKCGILKLSVMRGELENLGIDMSSYPEIVTIRIAGVRMEESSDKYKGKISDAMFLSKECIAKSGWREFLERVNVPEKCFPEV